MKPHGFSLIELLIAVAIISILAAIAVPNFLESQTRSKVSRALSDQRVIAGALEAYHADQNEYPPVPAALPPRFQRFIPLTTPVAYVSSIPRDPFKPVDGVGPGPWAEGMYAYGATPLERASRYLVHSDGPDRVPNTDRAEIAFYAGKESEQTNLLPYDPTNGTISAGDIYRTSDGLFSSNQ